MFLKKEKFTWQNESLTIFELSALQRIDFLTFMANEEKAVSADSDGISDQEVTTRLIGSNIRCGARLIAMSLWHNDPAGTDVETLYQQVLKSWPPEAIGKAEMQVKLLSGMLLPVEDEKDDHQDEDGLTDESVNAEPVTVEKPLPAS
ncbi:phage minor tail protein G [Klebsiella variicola]|uniref:Phage minor tail protein G n=1 Tax=Klebsiella variicola TaxID=244366 RepID=A0AAW9PE39_KLEVA|nr:phage minor tail protein G [Klebsiella variicola]MEC6056479.1 phage minor tail protein G [Klebsiella variicola]HBV9510974.1 phage minor tail protein G [Klebsiella pneumoniae]HEE4864437.1 phage minor tail protein G [Klebsiella pneumoniae]